MPENFKIFCQLFIFLEINGSFVESQIPLSPVELKEHTETSPADYTMGICDQPRSSGKLNQRQGPELKHFISQVAPAG